MVLAGLGLAVVFWPRAVPVSVTELRVGPIRVAIDEDGRTRVRNPYVVSTPIAGTLQRVEVRSGDIVTGGETVIATMLPSNPEALDIRTREQAHAAVRAAEAALHVAQSNLRAAEANRDYADGELDRIRKLVDRGVVSQAALDRAEQAARVGRAEIETHQAAIAMRRAEVNTALARLIGFDDRGLAAAIATNTLQVSGIPIVAPIDGIILKVIQQSQTTLVAGAPILEIGDIARDLEVVAELLSSDAVQVRAGDPVVISDWGGAGDLDGIVSRIDPYGYTKLSALGVEEQRVETVIAFTGPETPRGIGHGFRVQVHIVIWQRDDALAVPSGALVRAGDARSLYVVQGGRAIRQPVTVGRDNGTLAELLDGAAPGDLVVLFPPPDLADGQRVTVQAVD